MSFEVVADFTPTAFALALPQLWLFALVPFDNAGQALDFETIEARVLANQPLCSCQTTMWDVVKAPIPIRHNGKHDIA
jgi:hypothetical protein